MIGNRLPDCEWGCAGIAAFHPVIAFDNDPLSGGCLRQIDDQKSALQRFDGSSSYFQSSITFLLRPRVFIGLTPVSACTNQLVSPPEGAEFKRRGYLSHRPA